MYSIKVTHNGEVRRLTIPLDGIVATAYEQLIQTVRNLFPDLQVSRSFCLTWQDDEGDTVTVSSEMELTEAIRVMSTMYGGNSLRFAVKKIEKPAPVSSEPAAPAPAPFVEGGDRVAAAMKAEEAIHYGVQCDECGMSPIVGLRYKCTSRRNYDLCTSCYNKRAQPFPMIKIEEPVGGRCRRGRGRGGKCDPFEMPPHGPPHHHLHGHHGHPGHHHRGGPHHHPHPHGGGRGGRGMFHWFGGAPGEGIPYEGCEDYYGPFSDPAAEKEGDKKEAPAPAAAAAAPPAPHPHPPRAHPFGGPFGPPHHGGPHPPMPPHGGIFGGRGGGRGGFCPFGAGGRGGGAGRGGPFPWGGTPLVVEAEIYHQPAATEGPAAAKEGTYAAAPAPAAAPQSEGSVVHVGVTCDVCGVSPITGPRYKCTVRDNYDVCAACYESQLQPYPMLKIVTNGGVGTVVTPAAPIVRDLNDEDAGLQAAISESFAFTNAAASAAAAPVPAADVPPALLSRSTISVTSATVDDNEGEGGVEDVYSEHSFTFVDKVSTPPSAAAAPAAAPAAPSPVDTERLFAEAAATAERVHLSLVWAKELQLLSDMGFTDKDELIPLLQQHIGTPASASTAAAVNPVRQVEGMQQVVAALLLGQSGVRR